MLLELGTSNERNLLHALPTSPRRPLMPVPCRHTGHGLTRRLGTRTADGKVCLGLRDIVGTSSSLPPAFWRPAPVSNGLHRRESLPGLCADEARLWQCTCGRPPSKVQLVLLGLSWLRSRLLCYMRPLPLLPCRLVRSSEGQIQARGLCEHVGLTRPAIAGR